MLETWDLPSDFDASEGDALAPVLQSNDTLLQVGVARHVLTREKEREGGGSGRERGGGGRGQCAER